VVVDDVFGKIEPELRHLGQDDPLPFYFILQDDVKSRDPVGRHQNQVIADIVDLADFSFFDRAVGLHL